MRNAYPLGAAAVRWRVLERWLAHGRRARVLVLGRRGAGKSTLVNALCGASVSEVGDVTDATSGASVHSWALGPRTADLWDVPGLRAGGRSDDRRRVVALLARAIRPDVVFALFQASEVDAGVDDDLRDLRAVLEAVWSDRTAGRRHEPKVFVLVTKVDELAPPDVLAPPFDADDEKRGNIERATGVLQAHLDRHGLRADLVLPVNAYVRFDRDQIEEDLRWNLAQLAPRVLASAPAVDDDEALDALRLELAARLSGACEDVGALFGSLAASEASREARDKSLLALPEPGTAAGEAKADSVAGAPLREHEASIHDGPDAALAALDRLLGALVFAATGDGGAPSRSAWDSLRRAVELRLAAGALPTRGVESRAARLRARSEVVARWYARALRQTSERWPRETVLEFSREEPAPM